MQGGLVSNRLYLLIGVPGTGKTMAGLHFLQAGLDTNEDVLFVHGEEARKDIEFAEPHDRDRLPGGPPPALVATA